MKKSTWLILLASLAFFSFSRPEDCKRQGIKGYVRLVKGNQMPSPDRIISQPAGIKTSLYIFELTNVSQVVSQGAFYTSVSSKLIKEVKTNDEGYFKVKLKPGIYSLFVKKGRSLLL